MHKIDWYIKPYVYVYDIFRRIWITICFTKDINVNDEKITHQDKIDCRRFSSQISITVLLYLICVNCTSGHP